jgi:hypothetical protein
MLAQSSLLLILLSKDGPQFPPEIVNPNPLRNKAFFFLKSGLAVQFVARLPFVQV